MIQKEGDPINWFKEQGISNYEVVLNNPRKGRISYLFTDKEGNKRFLKWNDTDEQFIVYTQSLKKEESIYKSLQSTDIAPHYIGGGRFITEGLSGVKTLRTYIKELIQKEEKLLIYNVITSAIDKWQSFIRVNLMISDYSEPQAEYDRYLYSTLLACPMNTEMTPSEWKRNRYILILVTKLLKHYINTLLNRKELSVKTIHGDLHLNNIVLDDNGSLFLVDFEDTKKCLPELELAYFMSQIHLLLKNECKIRKQIDLFIDENVDVLSNKKVFHSLQRIFDYTIKFNHAFR